VPTIGKKANVVAISKIKSPTSVEQEIVKLIIANINANNQQGLQGISWQEDA